MDLAAHKDLIRRQFAVQARAYPRTVRFRHSENVSPMIDLAQPEKTDRLLDVACGWGFVALHFAPGVASAAGLDLTPEMVDLARKVARERGVPNVEYEVGDVDEMRFAPGSFEIVTCRFTLHHFARPQKALEEMRRVLAPGGRIILYDFVAHADAKKAKLHNKIEKARDPSHVKIQSLEEFHEIFRASGLKEEGKVATYWKRDFDRWMAFVDAGEDVRGKVRKLLEATIEGNKAGLGARVRGGKLTFTHTCACWRLAPRA